jgi:hypothetical protein
MCFSKALRWRTEIGSDIHIVWSADIFTAPHSAPHATSAAATPRDLRLGMDGDEGRGTFTPAHHHPAPADAHHMPSRSDARSSAIPVLSLALVMQHVEREWPPMPTDTIRAKTCIPGLDNARKTRRGVLPYVALHLVEIGEHLCLAAPVTLAQRNLLGERPLHPVGAWLRRTPSQYYTCMGTASLYSMAIVSKSELLGPCVPSISKTMR